MGGRGEDCATTPSSKSSSLPLTHIGNSFFSETDITSGLASALPPQVGSGGPRDSMGGGSIGGGLPVQMRTGALSDKELKALQDGLKSEQVRGAVTRDSDLGVDEEYERKMNMVNNTNHGG